MLASISALLVCQLVGEVIARLAHVPIPGPVIGMLLLFVALVIKGGIPAPLESTANSLLSHLSLLFVPAGVGIMVNLAILEREWLPISVSVIVSTTVTIAITGWVTQTLERRRQKDPS